MIGNWYAAEGLALVVVFAMFAVAFIAGALWDSTPVARRLAEYVDRADQALDIARHNVRG